MSVLVSLLVFVSGLDSVLFSLQKETGKVASTLFSLKKRAKWHQPCSHERKKTQAKWHHFSLKRETGKVAV